MLVSGLAGLGPAGRASLRGFFRLLRPISVDLGMLRLKFKPKNMFFDRPVSDQDTGNVSINCGNKIIFLVSKFISQRKKRRRQ